MANVPILVLKSGLHKSIVSGDTPVDGDGNPLGVGAAADLVDELPLVPYYFQYENVPATLANQGMTAITSGVETYYVVRDGYEVYAMGVRTSTPVTAGSIVLKPTINDNPIVDTSLDLTLNTVNADGTYYALPDPGSAFELEAGDRVGIEFTSSGLTPANVGLSAVLYARVQPAVFMWYVPGSSWYIGTGPNNATWYKTSEESTNIADLDGAVWTNQGGGVPVPATAYVSGTIHVSGAGRTAANGVYVATGAYQGAVYLRRTSDLPTPSSSSAASSSLVSSSSSLIP